MTTQLRLSGNCGSAMNGQPSQEQRISDVAPYTERGVRMRRTLAFVFPLLWRNISRPR